MPAATYTIELDADADELFEDDVTADVRSADGVSIRRGNDIRRPLAPPRPAEAAFNLGDDAAHGNGRYKPGGAAGLAKGDGVRIRATDPLTSVVSELFRGLVDVPRQQQGLTDQLAEVEADGALARISTAGPTATALYESITTGAAIGHLLDAIQYPKNAQEYVTDLAPAGQWGLGHAGATATDLSGNGNDGTVTYAEGQLQQASLDDAGDGAMKFEPGTTNEWTNPRAGAGATTNVSTSGTNTIAAVTFASEGIADPVIDGVAVTTGFKVTYQDNQTLAYHVLTLTAARHAGKMAVYLPAAWDGGDCLFQMEAGFTSATVHSTGTAAAATTDEWQEIESGFTPDAGDLSGTPRLYAASAPTAGRVLYFTAVQVELGDAATTYCDGAKGTGYSWSGTAHASTSTRVSSSIVISDDAAIQDIFDGGGGVGMIWNPTSVSDFGVGDYPRLIWKRGASGGAGFDWHLSDESGGTAKLRLYHEFSTTDGWWRTTDAVVRLNEINLILGVFDADSASNTPTIYVYNATDGLSTLTVGGGIDVLAAPAGTRSSDVGNDLYIGNTQAGDRASQAVLDEVALFDSQPTAAEFKAWTARVLDAPRHIEAGLTTLRYWWVDDRANPWTELVALLNTEGPGAALYEDGTGAIVFKDRHHRITETRANTVQATFRGSGTEPVHSPPAQYDDGRRDVINHARYLVRTRSVDSLAAIWSLGSTVTLGPNEARSYVARDPNGTPFKAAVTPVDSTDYTVTAGSLSSVTLERTSGGQTLITLTAGAAGATVTGLQLRGQLVSVDSETTAETTIDTSASIAQDGLIAWDFARHGVRHEVDINVAQDWCNAVPARYASGLPRMTLTVYGGRDAVALTEVLTREVSDRVAVHATRLGLAGAEFWIEAVEHYVSAGGRLHKWSADLLAASGTTYFTLDTSDLDGADVLAF